MKKTSLLTLVVCLAGVIGTIPAFANAVANLRVTLPYAISFGNVTLPAGEFTVTDTRSNGRETFFVIRSEAGPAVNVMMERDSESDSLDSATSAIELRRVGDRYEITGLRIDGENYKVSQ